MEIICLVDKYDTRYQYCYLVKRKQVDRITKFIDNLIRKWYGNRHDYYENEYGGVLFFIEYKLKQAHIYFEIPRFNNLYF